MIGHMIFGLIIGFIAEMIMGKPGARSGLIVAMVVGLVGAWLGGMLGRALGMYKEGHPAGFFMALLGAIILLFIYHLAAGRQAAVILFGM
jgi:uncharacterized membrane protein YeaQ/YmgE (transglycosylase-associated protein family)